MSAKPEFAVSPLTRGTTGAATGGFVINLTSSTTPMALSQPKDPTLAQYTFFVSRRREDGRERFRLHMGYFETLQAAEEMLTIVREVYPSAWAGEAPGKNLRAPGTTAADAAAAAAADAAKTRARATAPSTPAPAAPAPRAAAPAPKPAPVPVAAAPVVPAAPPRAAVATPPPAPRVSAPPPPPKAVVDEPFVLSDPDFEPMNVPVVHAPVAKAPPPKPVAPKAPPPKPAAAKPAVAKPAAPPVAPRAAAAPPARATPAKPPAVAPKIAAQVVAPPLRPQAPASPVAPQAAKPAVPPAPPVTRAPPPEPTVMMPAMTATPSLSNVRQVLEELDDLSDTQTIRLLERHSPFREGSAEANVDEAIRVIKPEDAASMQSIKSDVKRNAPVLFAVQLDWSVTPFDMGKVPPLAIFNAYTLYTTEANREGRTWYGLRLGFFSDAVSAKQVAYYVRSDFKTVSVVPVTTIEKERANDLNASRSGIHRAAMIQAPAPTPQSMSSSNASGIFQLLDDDMPAHIEQDVDGETSPRFSKAANAPAPAPAAPAVKESAPIMAAPAAPASANSTKPKAKNTPKGKGLARRDAHQRVDEETLDQTLEILGASTLEIETDKTSDTGVRHLRVKVDKKGSKFASLIDRLSGKR